MLWTDDAALGCIFSLKEQSSCYILPSAYFVSATAITAQHLKYPADCKDKVLEAVAKKNGCYITEDKGHKSVYKKSKLPKSQTALKITTLAVQSL